MSQRETQFKKPKVVLAGTKNLQKEISSIIEEVVVIRTRKTTQNSLQRPPITKVKPLPKEGKKSSSPLRQMMKVRNLQHDKLKKTKRDKLKTDKINVQTLNESSKRGFTKKSEVCNYKIEQTDRKGILKKNKERSITPETILNENENSRKTTKTVSVKKKTVKFAEYDFNGRLKKTTRNFNENGKITKYSKFLEETHKNITKITGHVSLQDGLEDSNLNLTLFDENLKNLTTGQLDSFKDLNLTQSFWTLSPVIELLLNLTDRVGYDNDIDSLIDTFNLLIEPKSLLEKGQNSQIKKPYLNGNDLAEISYEEPQKYFDCESFIRANFSFPILAVSCITVFCVLLSNFGRLWSK